MRTYGYDAFGNRTHMTEGDRETTYTYNAMNQLMSRMDSMIEETYAYDRRGNLSLIMENGSLKNSYTYGALNRLEQAVNGNGEAAVYEYNGLGHRVGVDSEIKIRYTIDLTRGYHNLLEKEEAGSRQTYLWDGNVAGMREEKNGQNGWSNLSKHPDTAYYLQDELGSPIRLLDEEGNMRETYGYDEFGQDLYRNQGQIQPFGYTGYQSDRIAETYYAQAREYRAELGRFAGVDIIKGFAAAPYTLNEYGYCWENPMVLVDLDGKFSRLISAGALVAGVAVGKATDRDGDIWSLKNDKQGREILLHYLYGDGDDLEYSDGEWGEYMKNNDVLKQNVAEIVLPYADDLEVGTSIDINVTTAMEIENGEDIIGYQYLHGTNADAGGFQIVGKISKDNNGNIVYDLTYAWNDIIGPNYAYTSDSQKAKLAKLIPFADPTDYEIHITWSDKTIISALRNTGWLSDIDKYDDCIGE